MRDLKIFAKTVDEKARAQIDLLLDQEPFKGCKVRIMPDVHAGAGCVIGFTANLGDKIIPNIVGVDIGCGMLCAELGKSDLDYARLDRVIREKIPSGMSVRNKSIWSVEAQNLKCFRQLRNVEWLDASMGTLGGGNHFIEIDEDEYGGKHLVIHTGSRNLGKQVAEIYQDKAVKRLHGQTEVRSAIIKQYKAEGRESEIEVALKALKPIKIPKELAYLEGADAADYLHDMKQCQAFATMNRLRIASDIWAAYFGEPMPDDTPLFETVHNYIDDENMVRKGAISAKSGQLVLIPLNMRDGCIIGVGLGNPDWNESAPHGAGRIMSRKQAREAITLDEFRNEMNGIYTTSATAETIDEAPQAYKPAQEIIDMLKDTVKIVRIIKPVYNFKASE